MSMPSRRILLLVCVLALALAAGAVATADVVVSDEEDEQRPAEIIEVQNSSNYLSATSDNVTQESHTSAGLDVSGAVEADALALQGTHERLALESALEAPEAHGDIEVETLEMLESDTEALERQQQRLFADYSEGGVDTSTLVREVVRLEATAEQYRQVRETILEEGVSSRLTTRYSNLEGEAPFIPSPIAPMLEAGLAGEGDIPLYVQGGNDSLVLATVSEDGTYLREAVLHSNRDTDAQQQFGAGGRSEAEDAFNRAEFLYPWASAEQFRPDLRGFGNNTVYRFTSEHSHGVTRSYLDGATTNPFYEIHEKNALTVPVADFSQRTDNNLRLTVESIAPTGPILIDVRQTGGASEQINVYIDDTHVKTLDGSGDFWSVQPIGSFEVTAENEAGEEVSVFFLR